MFLQVIQHYRDTTGIEYQLIRFQALLISPLSSAFKIYVNRLSSNHRQHYFCFFQTPTYNRITNGSIYTLYINRIYPI